jgi:uncharacterized membrane protein
VNRFFHFERRADRLASRRTFVQRLWRNVLWALAILGAWLAIGIAIYGIWGGRTFGFIAAFESAAMIVSGMGPLEGTPHDGMGGFFIGLYALGSLFIGFIVPSLVLAPVFHRVLHRFHLEDEERE